MKQIYQSLIVLILTTLSTFSVAIAQKDSTKLNQSVEVMKAYHPSINNAHKVNLLPVVSDTTVFSPEFSYAIDSQPIHSGFLASSIKPEGIKQGLDKDLGLGYLKIGAGTSATVLGEFFLNLPESKSTTFGMHLRHYSSNGTIKLKGGDVVSAPLDQDNAAIFGSVNLGSTILSTDLSYDRDARNYYGYPISLPAKVDSLTSHRYGMKQAYEKGDFKIGLRSSESIDGNLMFNGGVHLGFFNSKTGQKESSSGAFGNFDYNFSQFHGILDISYDHYATDSITLSSGLLGTKNNDWIRISPSIRLDGDNWSLRGGVCFITLSDKDTESTSKLYPDFEFNIKPVEGILTLYAGFKGDLKNNKFSTIANENYWADPRHTIRNTDYNYIVSGGLKGKISNEISYNLGVKYSQAKDLYFYTQNSFSDLSNETSVYDNQFDVVYDNAKITDFSGEFSYISGKDLSVIISGHYYNYKLEKLPFASQRPNFDLSASTGLRIIDKLTGFVDLEIVGARQSKVDLKMLDSSIGQSPIQIDPIIRLNMGANYELTRTVKIFGRVENLLNKPNEQWLGYVSQGLRLIAGVTFSF